MYFTVKGKYPRVQKKLFHWYSNLSYIIKDKIPITISKTQTCNIIQRKNYLVNNANWSFFSNSTNAIRNVSLDILGQ